MNFKKKVNGSWADIPHYIHKTATDTITTLPADVYADGNSATVGLVGNMSQSGTPTPTAPIQPSECGERTGNLFDYTKTDGIIANTFINKNGNSVTNTEYYMSYPIYVTEGETYTWTFHNNIGINHTNPTVAFYDASNTLIGAAQHDSTVYYFSFTIPNDCKYIRCPVFTRNNAQTTARLNLGAVSLPWEIFGYKIPILNNSQTTNVYLGEVQTTRQIKKYEITGNERWVKESLEDTPNRYHGNDILSDCGSNIQGVCSHYIYAVANAYGNIFIASNKTDIFVLDENITSTQALSEYFAQQYANGTPVTVWYVLATPTTGIVNEPLRKIGDYADTVSGITIPTIAGKQTFDVDTTLKPSEVELTYTGWHPVADVHERESGQWD